MASVTPAGRTARPLGVGLVDQGSPIRASARVCTSTRPPTAAARHWRQHVPLRHRQRRPHPDGPAARLAQGLLGGRPRWRRHQGGARAGRHLRRPGRLRDHGPRHPGRRRPEPGPPGRGRRRHPDVGALVHPEQGLPLRHRRDRAGRPADPRRRVRHRGGRRHGVDDPGAAPAGQLPHRHQVRRHQADRLDGPRRPDRHLRPGRRWARSPSRPTAATASPARSRTSSPRPATRRPPPRRRTASSTTRSPPSLIPQRKGDPIEFREDEGIRADTTAESLSKLKPAFAKDGTITAGVGLADLRRRLRGRRHERGEGRRAGPDPARRDRRARRRRRPGRHPADPAVAGHRQGAASARASTPRTSTSSRSTRPSPRSASSPPASSASTPRRSTSTAARSRWATRSA